MENKSFDSLYSEYEQNEGKQSNLTILKDTIPPKLHELMREFGGFQEKDPKDITEQLSCEYEQNTPSDEQNQDKKSNLTILPQTILPQTIYEWMYEQINFTTLPDNLKLVELMRKFGGSKEKDPKDITEQLSCEYEQNKM